MPTLRNIVATVHLDCRLDLKTIALHARNVQKLGFDAKFLEFKIQNIVGDCDVKFPFAWGDWHIAMDSSAVMSQR